MLTGLLDNLLLNGDFAPALWSRLEPGQTRVECPAWRQTLAADRWILRHGAARGAAVTQAISLDVPAHAPVLRSLEICGAPGVAHSIFLGQRLEAADAARYRRRLLFSAWVRVEHPDRFPQHLDLVLATPREPDHFAERDALRTESCIRIEEVPVGRWWLLERELDARAFAATGLALELEFPAEMLASADACVRLAGVRLADAAAGQRTSDRHPALERQLVRRYFQRHDSSTVNSLGRALVVNAHELHFQFTFPEMRAFPAVTLPHDETQLRVFNLEGRPQEGFTYDITYRSRGSCILRATKARHGLPDGFLSFVGCEGAILLDAEL